MKKSNYHVCAIAKNDWQQQFCIATITAFCVVMDKPVPQVLARWNGHHSNALNRIQQLSATPEFKQAAAVSIERCAEYISEQYLCTYGECAQSFYWLPDELKALGVIPSRKRKA